MSRTDASTLTTSTADRNVDGACGACCRADGETPAHTSRAANRAHIDEVIFTAPDSIRLDYTMHRQGAMKSFTGLLVCLAVIACASEAHAQRVTRDIPYATAHERQVLDVYAPDGAKNLPVVFWIHGGGWQTGDKGMVALKPKAFTDAGLVFVSINHRLLPTVEMGAITRDVAAALGWVHKNIGAHGGDPARLLVMGHSSGGQLAALMCTDDRYAKGEGIALTTIKGCVSPRS